MNSWQHEPWTVVFTDGTELTLKCHAIVANGDHFVAQTRNGTVALFPMRNVKWVKPAAYSVSVS